MKQKLNIWLLTLMLVLLAGFAPGLQGIERFKTLIGEKLTVTNSATIQDATLDDAVITDATITGVTLAGTVTSSSAIVGSAGGSFSPNIVVSAPTAIATATPAAYINNAGAHNSLVIAKNATPNFTVGNGGAVTGQVLQYVTSGQRQFCATNTITDTVSYTSTVTAVTTPVFTWCSMGAITGDANNCAASHATGSVTVIVRNSNATPAANAVGAVVHWCVVGTP